MRRRAFFRKVSSAVSNSFELTINTFDSSYFVFPNPNNWYNEITVDWGDGNIEVFASTNWYEHYYASAGVYNITVTGILFGINFNWTGEGYKLLNISNWGNFALEQNTFEQCPNLTCSAIDSPLIGYFGGVNLSSSFFNCSSINPNVSSWDLSAINNIDAMFGDCFSFDQSLENWNISSLGTAINFLSNGQLSTANYDATLISWASQPTIQFGVQIDFGFSQYTAGGAAQTAWETLVFTYGWTILDGGSI